MDKAYNYIVKCVGNNQGIIEDYMSFVRRCVDKSTQFQELGAEDIKHISDFVDDDWFNFEEDIEDDTDYTAYYSLVDTILNRPPYPYANVNWYVNSVSVACVAIILGWDWDQVYDGL